MARFTGTADNQDINVALALAVEAAKEGLGSEIVNWTLVQTYGTNGGFAGKTDLTVEIEASVP